MNFSFPSKIPFYYKISINYGNFHQSGNPSTGLEIAAVKFTQYLSSSNFQLISVSVDYLFAAQFQRHFSLIAEQFFYDWTVSISKFNNMIKYIYVII